MRARVHGRGVAMPSSTKDSDEVPRERPPSILYHYTSLPALQNILDTKELWISHYSTLNDRQELAYARALYERLVGALPKRRQPKPFDSSGVPRLAIASFSEENDVLSQWRAYTPQSRGICVGFRSTTLQALRLAGGEGNAFGAEQQWDVLRVAYAPGEQLRILGRFLEFVCTDHAHTGEALAERFAPIACCLKNPYFHEEREWRLLVRLPEWECFRVRDRKPGGNDPVPYATLKFDAPLFGQGGLIESITLGPGWGDRLDAVATAISAMFARFDSRTERESSERIFRSHVSLKEIQ